nr:unnamed protein product [Spirometra erinaceieuropaei]
MALATVVEETSVGILTVLMDFGCAAPPITSDTVRRLLRRKLLKLIDDKAIFPEEDQKFSDAEMDDPDVYSAPHGLRQRSAVQYPEGTDQIAGSEGIVPPGGLAIGPNRPAEWCNESSSLRTPITWVMLHHAPDQSHSFLWLIRLLSMDTRG